MPNPDTPGPDTPGPDPHPVPPEGGAAKWRRRAVLAAGAGVLYLWVRYLPRLPEMLSDGPEAQPIAGLAPFRSLDMGGGGGASAALAGIGGGGPAPAWQALMPGLRYDPCAALFPGPVGRAVPVALFSDYACPNCRALEARIAAYRRANPGRIRVFPHQLPLLGPASVLAAKAVLAAGLQGGFAAFDRRLKAGGVPRVAAGMAALARQEGLDPQRLLRDMEGPQVAFQLNRDRALAELFGFYATPGTVAGRTAFLGDLPDSRFARIIAAEAREGPVACA